MDRSAIESGYGKASVARNLRLAVGVKSRRPFYWMRRLMQRCLNEVVRQCKFGGYLGGWNIVNTTRTAGEAFI